MLSVYELMEIKKPDFTENDNIIYEAIKEYPGIVERYTVSQLADFLNISTASIMRFTKKMGYSGYSEFRYEYMKHAHNNDDSINNTTELSLYIRLITESFNQFAGIDEKVFTSLASEIKKHKNVFAIGSGKSGLVCDYMSYSFIRAGKNIHTATETVKIRDLPKASSSGDLYIYFSEKASAYSDVLKEFLENIHSSKAKVILITCNQNSVFKDDVYKTIVIPNISSQQEGIRSHALMLGFIDILFSYYIQSL